MSAMSRGSSGASQIGFHNDCGYDRPIKRATQFEIEAHIGCRYRNFANETT